MASKRSAKSVEHLPQQIIADANLVLSPQALNRRPGAYAFEARQGTEGRVLLIKADDLSQDPFIARSPDLTQIANSGLGQTALQQHAVDPQHPTAHGHR